MKITELAPVHAGNEVRISDPGNSREAQGTLQSVSFQWEADPDSWGGGLRVRVAELQISEWKIEVSPHATVDLIAAAHIPVPDPCGLAGGEDD
jgi:hypothetical protein